MTNGTVAAKGVTQVTGKGHQGEVLDQGLDQGKDQDQVHIKVLDQVQDSVIMEAMVAGPVVMTETKQDHLSTPPPPRVAPPLGLVLPAQ